MMVVAHIPHDIRGKVAIKAIKLATQVDGLNIVTLGGKLAMRDEHVYGSNPKWTTDLRIFGEAGVVKEGKYGRTVDRCKAVMFVGYLVNREVNSMQMWNPETNQVIVSRDIIFLKCIHYERIEVEERLQLEDDKPQVDDDVDNDEELADNDGNDTFSANSDDDEFLDHESVAENTVINNATVT